MNLRPGEEQQIRLDLLARQEGMKPVELTSEQMRQLKEKLAVLEAAEARRNERRRGVNDGSP
jgi:hypothetical protein